MRMSDSQDGPRMLSALLAGYAEVPPDQDREIEGLSVDSRVAAKGDLFLARSGQHTHGGRHVSEALEAGVAAVAWESLPGSAEPWPPGSSGVGVPAFTIDNLGNKIGVIADRFYAHPSHDLFVVGITGTDGKTSCSQFLAAALDQSDARCGVIGTLGYGLRDALEPASHTTPEAVRLQGLLAAMRDEGARFVVMEVSSHALDQGRVTGTAFDMAILTNLTRDHLDYHGTEQAYAQAKRSLFQLPYLRSAVLNLDDPFGQQLVDELGPGVRAVGYGFEPLPTVDRVEQVIGSDLRLHSQGFTMQVSTPWGGGEIVSGLLGAFNASNILAVLSALLVIGLRFDDAKARVQNLQTVPGRMERFGGKRGQPLVVVDYAHTPDALGKVLRALRSHCQGRLWCVFGCGGDRDRGKRPLMGAAAAALADRIIVTDDNPRNEDPDRIIAEILSGIADARNVRVERDRAAAIALALGEAGDGDVVVVAGKGHEEFQLVADRKIPFSDRAEVQRLLAGSER